MNNDPLFLFLEVSTTKLFGIYVHFGELKPFQTLTSSVWVNSPYVVFQMKTYRMCKNEYASSSIRCERSFTWRTQTLISDGSFRWLPTVARTSFDKPFVALPAGTNMNQHQDSHPVSPGEVPYSLHVPTQAFVVAPSHLFPKECWTVHTLFNERAITNNWKLTKLKNMYIAFICYLFTQSRVYTSAIKMLLKTYCRFDMCRDGLTRPCRRHILWCQALIRNTHIGCLVWFLYCKAWVRVTPFLYFYISYWHQHTPMTCMSWGCYWCVGAKQRSWFWSFYLLNHHRCVDSCLMKTCWCWYTIPSCIAFWIEPCLDQ